MTGRDLHHLARREGPSDNLCASFQMQSLRAPEHEELTTTMDAIDDKPFTTRAELPPQPEVVAREHARPIHHRRRRAIAATVGRRKED